MSMFNPPHPGRIVRQECVEALDLSVTEAAKVLDVTRQALNNLVNEKAAISPETGETGTGRNRGETEQNRDRPRFLPRENGTGDGKWDRFIGGVPSAA